MRVEDLMIGNYIQVVGGLGNDYIEEVISINDNFIGLSNSNTESNPQFHCDVDVPIEEVYGVPLSEEILLKCGFERLEETEYTVNTYQLGNIRVWVNNGKFFVLSLFPINYLHELQQFFKLITKQELEIKW